jgi:serine phosphatase RsbU (regulator of sigma subunit)
MFEELPKVAMGEVILPKNSLVVCYTDGLIETENNLEDEFGMDRLEKVILENFGENISTLNRNIVADVNEYRGDMPFIDDLAILSCRFF